MVQIRDYRMFSPKGITYNAPSSLKAKGSLQKRWRKQCKTLRQWMTTRKHLWTQQGSCTHKLSVVATACIKPVQILARREELGTQLSFQATKLLAIASYWERDRQFSLRVRPLVKVI